MINATTPLPANSFQFHDGSKEVMRITSSGVTVPPDVSVDEASKAVLAALDGHIKQVVSERDAVLRQALEALDSMSEWEIGDGGVNAIAAIKEVLNK